MDREQRRIRRVLKATSLDQGEDGQILEVLFADSDNESDPVRALFKPNVEGFTVEPDGNMAGIVLEMPIHYGVLPHRWHDDTIYRAAQFDSRKAVNLPPENLFMGLHPGKDRIVVLTWPQTDARLTLIRDGHRNDSACFAEVCFSFGSGPVHIGLFDAPGIWERVRFPEHLKEGKDKEISVGWQVPFNAHWFAETKLYDTPTAFRVNGFRRDKKLWKPIVGYIKAPFWFEEGKLFVRTTEQLDVEKDLLVYAREGHDKTPYYFAKRVLAESEHHVIPELKGTTGPAFRIEGAPTANIWHGACEGTNQMNKVLGNGLSIRDIDLVLAYINMKEGVAISREVKNKQYEDLIETMKSNLKGWAQDQHDSATAGFLDKMAVKLAELERNYSSHIVTYGGKTTADGNIDQIKGDVKEFRRLLQERSVDNKHLLVTLNLRINGPLNRAHTLGALCGAVLRQWFLQAGMECVDIPQAVPYALQIRREITKFLQCRRDEVGVLYLAPIALPEEKARNDATNHGD